MRRYLLVLAAMAVAGLAQAATVTSGTLTVTLDSAPTQSGLSCVTLDWGSNASGICCAAVTEVEGTIYRVVFNPDDGATSPSANYDVVMADVDGVDVLTGQGSNLSATNTLSRVPLIGDGATTSFPVSMTGRLVLAITSAGASRGGIIRVYLRR